MKPAPFRYHAPRSREELLTLLAELDDSRLLAGGQSLVPLLNYRLASPANLIDLNTVPGLDAIEIDGGTVRIGAMVRQHSAQHAPVIKAKLPLLSEALGHVGHRQTRNRGTIGGSLAHLDPTAELPVVATAMDATLWLESTQGERSVPFAQWPAGYLATAIEPGEVLTRVDIASWPQGHGWGFAEITRRGEGFAMVLVAALILCDSEGTITRAAIAIGGIDAAPVRATAAETLLTGRTPDDALIAAAAASAALLPAEGDLYAPSDYKQHLAGVLTERTLRQAIQRAGNPRHV
jgi:aerobic carbon-monoxide dehydrogenase medium subunit